MRKYFGTDGIRRIANTELSPDLVYRVAKSGAYVLSKHTDKAPTILIGRDTRLSGTLIESAMVAGFLSYGANVKFCQEEFPTRSYDGVVLESGIYDSLIVELGSAEGDNWWCVVYPPLCFVSNNSQDILYKSRILEILKSILG